MTAHPPGPRVAVLQPQTFMNDSGRSAGPARGAYKLDLDHLVVVHDEIDLPVRRRPLAPRRRAGGPQRAEVAQEGPRVAGLPPRADRRRPAGLDGPGGSRRLRARRLAPVAGRGAGTPSDRAAGEVERVIGAR